MPNHVYTTAHITGPAEVLAEIAKIASEPNNNGILEHYLPLPEGALEERTSTWDNGTTETYQVFSATGYGDAVDLWGSKWGDYDLQCVDYDTTCPKPYVSLRFQSAWSPVTEGYRKLSALLGIEAVLGYEDELQNYLGASAVKGGEVVYVEEYDPDEAEKQPLFTENVPKQPADEDAEDYAERWDEWSEAWNEAWNDLLVACEDNAFAALG
jgi:hypothetical protein